MRYAAFLRGIGPMNPNMRNDKLRRVVEELGGTNVATVISSGNIVFDSTRRSTRRLESHLEAAWSERLGFTSTTIVRSVGEVRDLIDRNPFGDRPDEPGARLQATFLKHPPEPGVLDSAPPPPGHGEVIALESGVLLTVMDTDPGTPNLMRWIETTLGSEVSTRTWRTVHRIAAKL